MADKDHLDNEVSVELSATESGVKAAAKSRFAAAVDRLGGNLVDWVNIPVEGANVRNRAKIEGERLLIEAVARHGVQLLAEDPEFAKRVLDTHFGKLARTQRNKDGVLAEALADLRINTQESVESGPPEPDAAFLDRLEHYAGEASTDELRSRWGRVLAAEIRKPGTFSHKVLRVIDELDGSMAQLFEGLCGKALMDDGSLCKAVSGDLSFPDLLRLVNAGLITDPGLGHWKSFGLIREGTDFELKAVQFGPRCVAVDGKATFAERLIKHDGAFARIDGELRMSIYVLTDAGAAISTILPINYEAIADAFADRLGELAPTSEILIFETIPDGSRNLRLITKRAPIGA